ncbi:penicillin-binding protein 2 [soil metagenome]
MLRPTNEHTRLRLMVLAALLVSALVVLVARLWFVQVASGQRYASLAERGRIREVTLEAPRGRILDRHGRVLVDNRLVHVIGVRVDEMGDRRTAVLADLAAVLGLPTDQLRDRIAADGDAVRPTPIAFDVPERIALYVWEHQSTRFPGVYADLVPRRSYPEQRLAAHVVGYAGEVTADQLTQPTYRDETPGAQVGLAGVERTHHAVLQGTAGSRSLEIDATGAVVREISERLPVPGADVELTLDRDIQQLAETELARGLRRARRLEDSEGRGDGTFAAPAGAAVLLDPSDGAVLAMASLPTFAPDDFVGGIAQARYANLIADDRHAPLLNRAVQAAYPPGSVFKIVSTTAAMRHGFATPDTTFPCPGTWRWAGAGQRFRNWTSTDLGRMTLRQALVRSCDTVYYELAERMWIDEQRRGVTDGYLTDEARRFGYGPTLGVDLPGERDGVVPGRRWRRRYWQEHHDGYCTRARQASDADVRVLLTELCGPAGAQWRGGDAVNLSIGQGDLLATPLQVATSLSVVANGGTVWRPRVAGAVRHADGLVDEVAPQVVTRAALDDDTLAVLRRGLRGVTAPGGTAAAALADAAWPVAGKTGTAESATQPFAWFAGYAPADAPRYVVAVVVEEGGSGSGTAAPIMRWIVDGLAELEQHRSAVGNR